MKLLKKEKSFDNPQKPGETIKYKQVYLQLDSGAYIAIKATYESDKKTLLALSEEVK